MLGKGVRLKTTARLFFVVSKTFEKLVNNRLVDHLENFFGPFFRFLLWFEHLYINYRTSNTCYGRISGAFDRSGATRAVVLYTFKAFDKVWHAGLPHKLKSFGILG